MNQQMSTEKELKEIREAIDAGRKTLQHLEAARDQLNAASTFGVADMMGFDLIGGVGKHMKMNRARHEMEAARKQVRSFQKELQDISRVLDFHVDIGGFLTLADFFFDGILADVLVQSKISQAKQQVDQAAGQVKGIMEDLHRMEQDCLMRSR